MKSVYVSRFFIFLPWVLIVIIMIEIDSQRIILAPVSGWTSRLHSGARTSAPVPAKNRSTSPTIYAITPTYTRPVQKAELTRLSHAFRQVPNFHWIVVEDATSRSDMVTRFLAGCGVPYTHLNALTPHRFKRGSLPRGTEQRNAALSWLRRHRTQQDSGVVYFADDDNTYTLELFKEMRNTQRVSVWPVGFTGGRRYERPLVANGKVVGWYSGWEHGRKFATDMAGFALNLQLILANPRGLFKRNGTRSGMQETDFLNLFTKMNELEPKANNCTQVLVWHTRTETPHLHNEPKTQIDKEIIEV